MLNRRLLLKTCATGAGIAPLRSAQRPQSEQRIHHDYQTNHTGTEYFILGNGLILAALQTAASPEAGTHCGLLLMWPERFSRKMSTLLYVPERGVQNSRTAVVVDGREYGPRHGETEVAWEYPGSIPTLRIEWAGGGCAVREALWCPAGDAVLIREVTVENRAAAPTRAVVLARLDANRTLLDEFTVDRAGGVVTATGYHRLELFSTDPARAGDRHIEMDMGELPPGGRRSATVMLALDSSRPQLLAKGPGGLRAESEAYWSRRGSLATGHAGLDHLFRCAQSGLRAAVARSGKMDGSIWQYNTEWVRDQVMVALGAVMAGHSDVSAQILGRVLTRSVDAEGNTVESSRYRPPETMELDQNGELLYTLWTHWAWTGDDAILRKHWQKIGAVAEYVLRPQFRDPAVGLLRNAREFWERDPRFGVREGYELAYQVWNIVGLEKGARMAEHLGESQSSGRWRAASALMKQSMLAHPTLSLVEEGRFIKRRLAGGEAQRVFEPADRKSMPPGMPLNVESVSYCDPDATQALPIALGLVDPQSTLARNTLAHLEKLWHQHWDFGGYARYDVSSEPDSPGPWPFATMFIARAYLEAGDHDKAWRALDWLLKVQGGSSGAWLEYYGDRPTPPLVPVGIVPWTWAEIVIFFVHHLVGVRPSPASLVIRPRLLRGLSEVSARAVVRGQAVTLKLRGGAPDPKAWHNGRPVPVRDGRVEIPLPQRDTTIEIHLSE